MPRPLVGALALAALLAPLTPLRLATDPARLARVAVIGGGFKGIEVAAEIAEGVALAAGVATGGVAARGGFRALRFVTRGPSRLAPLKGAYDYSPEGSLAWPDEVGVSDALAR